MTTADTTLGFSLARLGVPPDARADDIPPAVSTTTTDPTTDPVRAANDLANALAHASTRLFEQRRANPQADAARLLNLEVTLDRQAIALRTQALHLLGDQAAQAMGQLQDAAGRVDAWLAGVKHLETQLSVVSATIALAGAVLVGDASGVLTAVGHLHQALRAPTEDLEPGA